MTFFILALHCSVESESLQTLDGSQTAFESGFKTSILLVPLFKKQVRKELIPSLEHDERLVQILWDFLWISLRGRKAFLLAMTLCNLHLFLRRRIRILTNTSQNSNGVQIQFQNFKLCWLEIAFPVYFSIFNQLLFCSSATKNNFICKRTFRSRLVDHCKQILS